MPNTHTATTTAPTAAASTPPAAISLAAPALHQWEVSGLSTARSTAEFINSSAMTRNTQMVSSAISTGLISASAAAM